jgi:hypothetical protein
VEIDDDRGNDPTVVVVVVVVALLQPFHNIHPKIVGTSTAFPIERANAAPIQPYLRTKYHPKIKLATLHATAAISIG